MNKNTFFYKSNEDDRDCFKYIEVNRLGKLECSHYFPRIMLMGACFSGSESFDNYENIITVLTEKEYNKLIDYNKIISDLGCSIEINSDRYNKGIEEYKNIESIINKLLSEENEELFNKLQEEEKEFLKYEYDLDNEDIEIVFDNYYLDYKDRSIISHIFNDIDECSREEAEALGYITSGDDRYFDYEAFGNDLLNEERYCELKDGRIIVLSY